MKNIELNYVSEKQETILQFLLSKGFSSNNIFHEIKNKNVYVDGVPVRDKNILILAKQKIKIILNQESNDLIKNETEIEKLYEDEYLLIVNKPANLHVEPYKIGTNNNLASMVANYFFQNQIPSKVHLVNRLDKCTSGIVIIAKNRYIKNLMCNVEICKKYLALVEGETESIGTIEICIDKEPFSNSRKISENGKKSLTKYKTISYDKENDFSLVEAEIFTGRTHQIRLSFSSIGHPLVGDTIYNSKYKKQIFLKAHYIKFNHPIINKDIEIQI